MDPNDRIRLQFVVVVLTTAVVLEVLWPGRPGWVDYAVCGGIVAAVAIALIVTIWKVRRGKI